MCRRLVSPDFKENTFVLHHAGFFHRFVYQPPPKVTAAPRRRDVEPFYLGCRIGELL